MLCGAVLGGSVLGVWRAQVEHLQAPAVDYGAIAPILLLLGGACLSVLVEAFVSRPARWLAQVALTLLTLGAAGAALGMHLYSHGVGSELTLAVHFVVERRCRIADGRMCAEYGLDFSELDAEPA